MAIGNFPVTCGSGKGSDDQWSTVERAVVETG
ncbi:hypothetical protein CCACVL1_06292 [Corchorus capsularis]|uniref:Uncharacterized protein n=1 Tax=Corchorus capsularis TaxID=210143 RepID=A0A1R3JGD3_COCAP|nr:hypothetical protein CCACVL1_06292 [Corchorus capsularis]